MFIVILVILVVVVLALVGLYNRLVSLRVRSENAWSDIDVQLKRLGQFPCLAAIGAGYKQIGLVKGSGTADQIGDPLAVRRPARRVREVGCVRHFSLLSACHIQHSRGLQAPVIQPWC